MSFTYQGNSIFLKVFCAVLGSFVRGKEQMGDIDVLISPPANSDLLASNVLQEILNELLREKIITSDLHPDKLLVLIDMQGSCV